MKDAPRASFLEPAFLPAERRRFTERRRRIWWSIFYGSFRPRRRAYRRLERGGLQLLDWHDARLLVAVIAILALSVTDALLTLVLLAHGASEINPLMARFVDSDVATFTALKMCLTGASLLVMVLLAGHRFLRAFRVEVLIYLVLAGYAVLVGYELSMLSLQPEGLTVPMS